jgi:hypothetical protein
MSDRPANDEMVEGFRDGYDLSAPEPSDNRSHSYRHGFNAGRNDRMPYGEGPFHGMRLDEIRRLADEAMDRDETRH